jgi:glycosyltransferase involved in cell wall biosynthesis
VTESVVSVSVIVPVFNASSTIERTLASIKNQTLQNIEILCIDDCSIDGTYDILMRYARTDRRFKVCRLPENRGVSAARNEGVSRATGRYLCFLDADDWWLPEKLLIQFRYMEKRGLSLTYMAYSRVREDGVVYRDIKPPRSTSYKQLLCSNHIGNLTAMVRAEAADTITFKKMGHEDYFFWLEVLNRNGVAELVHTEQPLCFYLVRKGSLSSNKIKAAKWQWVIYREQIGLGLLQSLRYFVHYLAYAGFKRFP